MRYNFNDLDLLLSSGVSPDEIARAFTDELNSTIEKNKEDEYKKQAYEDLAMAWNSVVELWLEDNKLPAGFEEDDLYIDGADAESVFEELMSAFLKTAPILEALAKLADRDDTASKSTTTSSFDDIMKGFLAKI